MGITGSWLKAKLGKKVLDLRALKLIHTGKLKRKVGFLKEILGHIVHLDHSRRDSEVLCVWFMGSCKIICKIHIKMMKLCNLLTVFSPYHNLNSAAQKNRNQISQNNQQAFAFLKTLSSGYFLKSPRYTSLCGKFCGVPPPPRYCLNSIPQDSVAL